MLYMLLVDSFLHCKRQIEKNLGWIRIFLFDSMNIEFGYSYFPERNEKGK